MLEVRVFRAGGIWKIGGVRFSKFRVSKPDQAYKKWVTMPDKKESARALQKHLKMFALAESMTPQKIAVEELSDTDMLAALKQLSGQVAIPVQVQIAVTCRAVRKFVPKLRDQSSINVLVAMVWPWPVITGSDGAHAFAFEDPKCKDIEATTDSRVELFCNFFMRDVFIGTLSGDDTDTATIKLLVKTLGEHADGMLQLEHDQTYLEGQALCELCTVCGALRALLEYHVLPLAADMQEKLGIVEDLLKASHGDTKLFLEAVKQEIAQKEPYQRAITLLQEKKSSLLEVERPVRDHVAALDSITTTTSIAEAANTLANTMAVYSRLGCALGPELSAEMDNSTLEAVKKVAEKLLKGIQDKDASLEAVQAGLRMLKNATDSFPANALILECFEEFQAAENLLASAGRIAEFLSTMDLLKQPDDVGNQVKNIEAVLLKVEGTEMQLSGEDFEKVSSAYTLAGQYALKEFPSAERCGAVLKIAQRISAILTASRPASFEKAFEALEMGLSLHESAEKIKKSVDDDEKFSPEVVAAKASIPGDETSREVDTALLTHARLQQLFNALDTTSQYNADVKEACMKRSTAWCAIQADIGKEILKAHTFKMSSDKDLLQVLKGGTSSGDSGSSWLDDLEEKKRTSWTSFFNHAKKTIMKDKEVAKIHRVILAVQEVPENGDDPKPGTPIYFFFDCCCMRIQPWGFRD